MLKRIFACIFLLILVSLSYAQTDSGGSDVTHLSVSPTSDVDVSIRKLMKEHFRKGMKAFSTDDFNMATFELKASTTIKTRFSWQTWYVSAYKTLGTIYEFHSRETNHKALAYMYYSLASDRDPDAVSEKYYLQEVVSAKKQAETLMATPTENPSVVQSVDSTDDLEPKPHWYPAPLPKADSRNLYFDIYSVYENDTASANLFSIADLYAQKKLDEYSTTADLQVRFSKNISVSDSANEVDLRIAKITYLEPWLQISAGRMDIFPILTPMSFFGAYPDMGIHRVDGAMAVIPIFFEFGNKNDSYYASLPTAISVFYTPSLLEAGDVVLDTQQAFLLTQARSKLDVLGLQTSWSTNLAWTKTDYFTYSSLNGGLAFSATGDIDVNDEFSLYGEFGDQNTSLFSNTDVLGLGARVQKIGTWGPLSLDSMCFELQLPLENDPNNIFSGGNPFNPSLGTNSTVSWYGELKARMRAATVTFAITNNMDDFTLNRVNSSNSSFDSNGAVGPGRELEKSQIPLVAASYTQPAFLVSVSADF